MNKQEAKQKLHNIAFVKMNAKPDDLKLADVMQVINQIDEPQKVVVPRFVAEWIEYCKANGITLLGALDPVSKIGEALANSFSASVMKCTVWARRNQETFALAWIYGYEVEQEQLYTVEIPNPNNRFSVVFLTKEKGKVHIGAVTFLDNVPDDKWKKDPNTQLTESEIKQDFEWAWKWAEKVEVDDDTR